MFQNDEKEKIEFQTDNKVEIALGCLRKNTRNSKLLSRFYFPSKVGGKPAWLNPKNLPSKNQILCKKCHRVLSFLLQIYAPKNYEEGGNECTFHRSIYVFVCRECKNEFLVLRCQLPRNNKFYSNEPLVYESEDEVGGETPEEDTPTKYQEVKNFEYKTDFENYANKEMLHNTHNQESISSYGANVDKEEENNEKLEDLTLIQLTHNNKSENDENLLHEDYDMHLDSRCCSVCGIPDDKESFHRRCQIWKKYKSISETFDEFQIEIIDEILDENARNDDDYFHEKKLLEEYYKMCNENEKEKCEEEKVMDSDQESDEGKYEKSVLKKDDEIFNYFLKRIKYSPQHIIRYAYKGSPLYMYKKNMMTSKPPKCTICGSERVFEFQVNQNIISFLRTDSIDFAILCIYTCSNSCNIFENKLLKDNYTDLNQQCSLLNLSESNVDDADDFSAYIEEYVYVQPELF